MKISPHLLVAAALVAVGGAVGGSAIGDSPIIARSSQDSLPEAQIAFAPQTPRQASERPPNQYPLQTADGTIPVAELALHGRYRDTAHARSMLRAKDQEQATPASVEQYYSDEEIERLAYSDLNAGQSRQMAAEYSRLERPSEQTPSSPLPQADPGVPSAASSEVWIGNAKSIDVAAALEDGRS
ncbi:hypothetical protein GRI34_12595 [Erythrobacter aquimaris]|uniref:Uncharacterized protein n=1 Tax=Qipengyuania aquimaris TaxID=255984 RepID=A0A6I4TN44_9SPHN|nr:hypothetical protein [Qipengyuania aquimaris]MXO97256.1 hypothetical protein [Qipengyuania aquimaris]